MTLSVSRNSSPALVLGGAHGGPAGELTELHGVDEAMDDIAARLTGNPGTQEPGLGLLPYKISVTARQFTSCCLWKSSVLTEMLSINRK